VIVVGYEPATAAAQVMAVAAGLRAHVPVIDMFLVTGDRYICLGCPCDASGSGMPFDPATTVSAVESTLAGLVALPNRQQVMSLIDPDPVQQAATADALVGLPGDGTGGSGRLRQLLDLAASDGRLTAGQVARLVVLLRGRHVREAAWRHRRPDVAAGPTAEVRAQGS
jgi:hypothetical protein